MGRLFFRRLGGYSGHCSSLGLGCQLEKFPEANTDAPVHTGWGVHPTRALCVSCLTGRFEKIKGRLENKLKPDSSGIDLIPVEGAFGPPVGRRVLNSPRFVNLFCYRYYYMALLMFSPVGPGVLKILVLADISPRTKKYIHWQLRDPKEKKACSFSGCSFAFLYTAAEFNIFP